MKLKKDEITIVNNLIQYIKIKMFNFIL